MAVLPGGSSVLLHAREPLVSTGTHSSTYATARSMHEIFSIRLNLLFTEINLEDRQAGLFGRTVPSSSVTTNGCDNPKESRRSRLFPHRQLAPPIPPPRTSPPTHTPSPSPIPF